MRAFSWMRHNRTTINGVLITIFTSLIFNTISDAQGNLFSDSGRVLSQLIDTQTLSGTMTIVSLVLLVIFNAALKVLEAWLNRSTLSEDFPDFMRAHTSPQLVPSVGNGCLSWGEGKTVELCNDIIFGWDPRNVVVDAYDDEIYCFYGANRHSSRFGDKSYYFNEDDYQSFVASEQFAEVIRKGNNLPRFMLKKCSKNYDKHNRKLLITLGRTEWSQTSYVWDRFGKSRGDEISPNALMGEYARGISSGSEGEPYLPNSFCMHLLIETLDNKVVLSRISQAKINDNPGTWAATLGEQLELEDFTDGNNFYDDFVVRWLRRALLEEYKFDDRMYEDMVSEESLKVLSVDFESDRYNFALLCTVQLRYTFDSFCRKVAPILATEEAIELGCVDLRDIPKVLVGYDDESERANYHPSTYRRPPTSTGRGCPSCRQPLT